MSETEITSTEQALDLLDPMFKDMAQGAINASEAMANIQEKLRVNAGTVAQVNTFATNAVLSMDIPDGLIQWPTKTSAPKTVLDLATWMLDAEQFCSELVNDMRQDLLRSQVKSADQSDALKEEFATHKGVVNAFQLLASSMPNFPAAGSYIAEQLTVPDLRGSTATKSSGVRKGDVVWGITKKGEAPHDIGTSQNKFSSTRHYYSKYFTADGSDMTLDAWRQLIRSKCPDWKSDTHEFSMTNEAGDVTVWCEARMKS